MKIIHNTGQSILHQIRNGYDWIILSILILIILLFIHLQLFEYGFDDAFIHFRLVENWIDTTTPYFNINDPVKSSSSSAWIIFLFTVYSTASRIGLNPRLPQMAAVINSSMVLVGSLIYYKIILRVGKIRARKSVYFAFSITYFSLLFQSSIGLMETATALVIVGIAFLFFIDRKNISFTLFVISIFFRLELVVVFLLVLAFSVIARWFQIKKIFVYSLFGVIPFALFDFIYYGTLVPNTITAKSQVYELSIVEQIGTIISSIGNSIKLFPFFNNLSLVYLFLLIFIPVVILAVYTYRTIRRRENLIGIFGIIFLLWGVLILCFYMVSGVVVFAWYRPLFSVPLFLVIWLIISNIQDKRYAFWNFMAFTPILILQSMFLIQYLPAAVLNPAYAPGFAEGARTRQYIQFGQQLYHEYPQANLMSSEIGGLGYGFKGNIMDAGGLVTPEALDFHPLKVPEERSSGGLGGIPQGLVTKLSPEIIVSYDIFIEALAGSELIKDYKISQYPVFLEEDRKYSKVDTPWGTIQKELWGVENLYVFVRNDIPDLKK